MPNPTMMGERILGHDRFGTRHFMDTGEGRNLLLFGSSLQFLLLPCSETGLAICYCLLCWLLMMVSSQSIGIFNFMTLSGINNMTWLFQTFRCFSPP